MTALPPIVTFAAPSGTGKTTLICGVIESLSRRGVRVAVLKHDAHRLALDTPGKDSWRFRRAGATASLIAGDAEFGLFSALSGEMSVVGLVDGHLADADIVLTEGFRDAGHPVIRIHRAARTPDSTWKAPERVIAWASDAPVDTELPVLPLDDPQVVADFLLARFVGGAAPVTFRDVPFWNRPAAGRADSELTFVAFASTQRDAARLAPLLRAPPAGIKRALLVRAAGVAPVDGVPDAPDLRPEDGASGALLTALACANTPRILVVGPRHAGAPDALLTGLVGAALAERADVVVPECRGHDEPLIGVYGHRCLASLHGSLLSGERRMTAWWGQVRVARVPEAAWRAWDPDCDGFPS